VRVAGTERRHIASHAERASLRLQQDHLDGGIALDGIERGRQL
jgi:hypothetical protein